eukprot:7573518-Pyramimonas_sp.AAC.3
MDAGSACKTLCEHGADHLCLAFRPNLFSLFRGYRRNELVITVTLRPCLQKPVVPLIKQRPS